jgi:predicted dehydrogenase
MVRIGLIGYGHWGPNHVRVFNQFSDSRVSMVVDLDGQRLEAVRRQFPDVETGSRYEKILENPAVDAVIVATPVNTHHSLVKAALLAGKDVLVEKPITYTSAEAQELVELAERKGRVLMCGHIFLFNAGVRKLRQYIQDGTLGRVYYMAATRTNLGPLRRDVNALYDLGSHDVSIFHYLLDSRPREVSAWGESFLQHDIEDVAFGCLEYPERVLCHMHVSWLNPRKERTLVVVGDKKMVVYDDTSPGEAIRLYDKGLMQEPYYDSFGQFQLVLRDADVLIPNLQAEEPLKVQDQHFLECVRTRQRPLTDGVFARDVVFALEALQRSLHKGGSRQWVQAWASNGPSKAKQAAGLVPAG